MKLNTLIIITVILMTSCKKNTETISSNSNDVQMVNGFYKGKIPLSEAVKMSDEQYVHKDNELKYYNEKIVQFNK